MTCVLRVSGLGKRAGRQWLLRDVSFEVTAGETVSVTGPNGAGKSTLLQLVAGVMPPDRGVVSLVASGVHAHLGYLSAAVLPPSHLSVRELLALVAGVKRVAAPSTQWLSELGIAEFVDRSFDSLSTGQVWRACFAAALVGDPCLLVLDEPFAGLDTPSIDVTLNHLRVARQRGVAILAALHDTALLAPHRVLRLEGGRLVDTELR